MNQSSYSTKTSVSKLIVLGSAVAGLFLSGCQNYTQQSADFSTAWKSANLQGANDELAKKVTSNADNKDTIIWRLEQGAALRTAALAKLPAPPVAAKTGPVDPNAPMPAPVPRDVQLTKESISAFEVAEQKMLRYDDDAKVKMGAETGAALTNLANLPYRGRGYDRIMLHTYKALSYLTLGQADNARVELNRSLQRQREAVEENQKRITQAQKEAEDAKQGKAKNESGKSEKVDVDRAQKSPALANATNQMDAELNSQLKGYDNYVNPFSVFVDGMFFLVNGEGGSDMERARKSLERVAAMNPDNPYLKEDLALAENAATGAKPEGLTYVIFETGAAPVRQEWRVDIPFFLISNRVSSVNAAFPKLQFDNNFIAYADVIAGGQSQRTSLLCSMDSVIAQDFKNEWPVILTKTLIITGIKAALDAAVQNQTKDQGFAAQLLGKALTLAYNYGTTIADTRSWTTLPKQFQYCRVKTPQDRSLTISAGIGAPQTIQLQPGQVNLVIVKNVAPNLPVYISQVVLK